MIAFAKDARGRRWCLETIHRLSVSSSFLMSENIRSLRAARRELKCHGRNSDPKSYELLRSNLVPGAWGGTHVVMSGCLQVLLKSCYARKADA